MMWVKRRFLEADKYFEFQGAKIGYRVLGKGKPVVLVHGSMIADPWGGFDKELAKYYQVYLPHLPGFGASETVKGRLHSTELFAEVLGAFLRETNLEEAPIMAFSLGTVVTARVAIEGGARGQLIFVGAPVGVESRLLKLASLIPISVRRIIGATELGRKLILVPVLRDIIGGAHKPGEEKLLLRGLETTDSKALVDIDVEREVERQMPAMLKRLKNKVTFVYGERDKLYEASKNLVANPIMVKGAGHGVCSARPREVAGVVRKIVDHRS